MWTAAIIIYVLTVTSLASLCHGCGEQFIGRLGDGILTSPNFPFDYLSNQTCTYEFYVDQYDLRLQTIVCFHFRRFALPRHDPDCQRDYLSVGDNRYCEHGWVAASIRARTPPSLQNVWSDAFCWPVQDKRLTMTFTSTSGLPHPGFYATYRVFDVPLGERSPPGTTLVTTPARSTESLTPTEAPCGQGQWTCFNRQCVPKYALCNLSEECTDGSDEEYAHARCPLKAHFMSVRSCDFERECGFLGLHSWRKTRSSWNRAGHNTTVTTDHTYGHTKVGTYLLANFEGSRLNYTASFYTQSYHPQGDMCFSFWYQLQGKLTVEFAGTVVWQRVGNYTSGWHRGQAHIPAGVEGVARFNATKAWPESRIAIDDIDLSNSECVWDEPSCSFEYNDCGWKNRMYGHVDIEVDAGQAKWVEQDHLSRGGVMSLLLDNVKEDVSVNLTSPPLSSPDDATYCLYLEYRIPYLLDRRATLDVQLLKWDGRVEGRSLWSQNMTTPEWRSVTMEVTKSEPFQFQLMGQVRRHGSLKVFIDNVSVTRGHCPIGIGNMSWPEKTGGDEPCARDPSLCSIHPTFCDGRSCLHRPGNDGEDESSDDRAIADDETSDTDASDIVSMTSIGLACAVSVVLVLVIGLWVIRMRKRSSSAAQERSRPRTDSVQTDSSSVAGDQEYMEQVHVQDVPPSYSDAVRLPQPRPTLELAVWTISENVERSPPPAYADIVDPPLFPQASNVNIDSGTAEEQATVHISSGDVPLGVVYHAGGQFVEDAGSRVYVPDADIAPVHDTSQPASPSAAAAAAAAVVVMDPTPPARSSFASSRSLDSHDRQTTTSSESSVNDDVGAPPTSASAPHSVILMEPETLSEPKTETSSTGSASTGTPCTQPVDGLIVSEVDV